jgi:hypothetical protein
MWSARLGYRKLRTEAVAAEAGVGKQIIDRGWSDRGSVLLDPCLAPVGADQGLTCPTAAASKSVRASS